MLVALAGGNFIHDAAGFLEFCITASYDKLVIDDEIIGMIMRAVEGIKVDDDTLAFDILAKAGPGGHFVSNRHTRKYMRTELYQPRLSDRNNREKWEKEGKQCTQVRASEKVRAILGRSETPVIPPEVCHKIRQNIPNLKPGII